MAPSIRFAGLCLSGVVTLSGCAAPPQGAGHTSQILAGAEDPAADFAVVPVTRDTLPMIAKWPSQPSEMPTAGWLPRGGGVRQDIIAAGDKFDVSIWNNDQNGLLTLLDSKVTPLPGMKVSSDGTLFLPYVGAVPLAGMTVDAARQEIQDKLVTIMPSAQVLLSHQTGRDNAVQVISGLPTSGQVGMPDRDFTVLDLISTAGGIPVTMINPQVRVARGGKVYGVDFADLMQHPEMDAVLKPGDRIYVVPESRHFLSFGAASKEMMVPFPAAKVSALDAVALIGGLIDTEADAKGVLVLRDYPASAVRSDGKGPTHKRMIFAFNLLSADGLFSAGEFKIQDKDLVMVAQSPLLTETAVLNFVNALLNAGNSAVAFGLNQRKF